ncbi:hypothetical protein D7X55_06220 [Corallococcus sp. AB049A]|uniref:SGNH/GDSL hydrolase family protein n=1 Tax=Corallococcus interemptor TaxID=2316720 RepID=A0A3A8QXZ1_9BACT|nr:MULTISPECIES: hypothetical protein [Corallococcus]RKH51599.1 hypothetical protein D7Y23_09550 [Corallococcus sp. AB050B]RKH71325.1 hypothetical protein D7X96_08630 [Corallococcus interemptor]RKI73066.1 hypothetical protein D7X55_06220 [Corallococcus sp. AB049A]
MQVIRDFPARLGALLLPGALLMALPQSAAATAQVTPDAAAAGLERLTHRRVFFGHQSVGGNILDGVRGLSPSTKAPAIVEVKDASTAIAQGTLAHAFVGQNEQPETKIAHFERLLDGGVAKQVDVALMKFCYIDFTSSTDAKALFEKYRTTLAGLKSRHPGVTFVHVTAPLTTVQRGAKAWFNELRGRPVFGVGENVSREAFNALMRQTYGGKEPLFDLAALESSQADGSRETYEVNGRAYPAMVPDYSDDGGHLNAAGQARVAPALIAFLAALPEAPASAKAGP